ncbi:MAG: hypothetical protein WAN23_01020, partial [Candidatus Acidiferrales bacterium]
MRTWKSFCLTTALVGALAGVGAAQTQTETQTQTAEQTQPQPGASTSAPVTTVNQAIDRIIAREHDENATIRRYDPIVETYIQDMKTDKDMAAAPIRDHYFLGQANLSKGIVDNNMLNGKRDKISEFNPLSH